MMARKGFIFHGVCIVGVLLLALACASGDDEPGDGVATGPGATGGSIGTGGTGGQSTAVTDPMTTVTGGTTVTATGGGTGGAVCGNNIKEDGEVCDGTDLAGADCAALMGAGAQGSLSCNADCLNYNTSMCYEPEPTGGTTSPEAGVGDGGYGGA